LCQGKAAKLLTRSGQDVCIPFFFSFLRSILFKICPLTFQPRRISVTFTTLIGEILPLYKIDETHSLGQALPSPVMRTPDGVKPGKKSFLKLEKLRTGGLLSDRWQTLDLFGQIPGG
jgi:hypothetical protein